MQDAIATWADVLEDCFDGLITLTNVTGKESSEQRAADIVVHYVPTAGGVVFGGYAICGDHGCPNILVRSDLPPSLDRDPYNLNILAGSRFTRSVMRSASDMQPICWKAPTSWGTAGQPGHPVLSQCDIDALAFVFAWAIEGTDPQPPGAGPYVCDP